MDAGASTRRLPLKQTGQVFVVEFLYRIGWKFFLGPRLLSGNFTITAEESTPPPPPEVGVEMTLTGLVLTLKPRYPPLDTGYRPWGLVTAEADTVLGVLLGDSAALYGVS
jgi:hypothetical protein